MSLRHPKFKTPNILPFELFCTNASKVRERIFSLWISLQQHLPPFPAFSTVTHPTLVRKAEAFKCSLNTQGNKHRRFPWLFVVSQLELIVGNPWLLLALEDLSSSPYLLDETPLAVWKLQSFIFSTFDLLLTHCYLHWVPALRIIYSKGFLTNLKTQSNEQYKNVAFPTLSNIT